MLKARLFLILLTAIPVTFCTLHAQTLGQPERFTATAIVNNNVRSGAGIVQIGKDGKGKGTLSYATKVIAHGDTIVLENFGIQPVMLTEIRAEVDKD